MSNSIMNKSHALGRSRTKFSFRAFYISTIILCALALFSLGTTQYSRYTNGEQHGVLQRRAVAALDLHRLVKRDEEVCAIPVSICYGS